MNPSESPQPPPSDGVQVFLSYRRKDTAGHAGRLYDTLRSRLDRSQVFMDIDAIEPGVDFVDMIHQAVGQCDVLLALIGPDWLTMKNDDGDRRIDEPGDYVRIEIEAALARDIRVIPVLVDGARMPATSQLPASIAAFGRRNSLEITDARWAFDAGRLVELIERIGSTAAGSPVGAQPASSQVGTPIRAAPPDVTPTRVVVPPVGGQPAEALTIDGRSGGRRTRSIAAVSVAAVLVAAVGFVGLRVLQSGGQTGVVGPSASSTASASRSSVPSPTGGSAYAALRAKLPTHVTGCHDPQEAPMAGQLVTIHCMDMESTPEVEVLYRAFGDRASLDAAWSSRVAKDGFVVGAGACPKTTGEMGWPERKPSLPPTERGRLLCYISQRDEAVVEWTSFDHLVWAVAWQAGRDLAAMDAVVSSGGLEVGP